MEFKFFLNIVCLNNVFKRFLLLQVIDKTIEAHNSLILVANSVSFIPHT